MADIVHIKGKDISPSHKHRHDLYEYFKYAVVPRDAAKHCAVSVYELPFGKSAYPYHYHTQNEEVFYILSGTGTLRTPAGESPVSAGDFLFFPACEAGAHKLINTGEETLTYIDFDVRHDIDVAFYPDSGKIGVWGENINQLYKTCDQVNYYEDE